MARDAVGDGGEVKPEAAAEIDRPPAPSPRRRWPYLAAVLVLVVGLLATAGLVVLSSILYRDNEKRLLKLRAGDAAAVLSATVPSIQTPLVSAVALADATHANRRMVASKRCCKYGSGAVVATA